MRFLFIAALCVALITLAGCASNTTTNTPTNSNRATGNNTVANTANSIANTAAGEFDSMTGMTDQAFLKAMAISGASQVELGKMASSKASDPEVQEFARTMVTEHSRSNEDLKALTLKLKVEMPASFGSGHKPLIDNLRNRAGTDFDKAYVKAMVEVHEATVADFESKVKDAADPDLKAFVEKSLPTLRQHRDMINAIHAKTK